MSEGNVDNNIPRSIVHPLSMGQKINNTHAENVSYQKPTQITEEYGKGSHRPVVAVWTYFPYFPDARSYFQFQSHRIWLGKSAELPHTALVYPVYTHDISS